MVNPSSKFSFKAVDPSFVRERFAVAKETDDDVGFEFGEPFIGRRHSSVASVAGAPAVGGFGERRVEFIGLREGPGGGARRVGSEPGGVSFITHVANEEIFLGVL